MITLESMGCLLFGSKGKMSGHIVIQEMRQCYKSSIFRKGETWAWLRQCKKVNKGKKSQIRREKKEGNQIGLRHIFIKRAGGVEERNLPASLTPLSLILAPEKWGGGSCCNSNTYEVVLGFKRNNRWGSTLQAMKHCMKLYFSCSYQVPFSVNLLCQFPSAFIVHILYCHRVAGRIHSKFQNVGPTQSRIYC